MTPEQLQDAMNLLPGDLIRSADTLRCRQKTTISFRKRILPLAACVALVLGCSLVVFGRLQKTTEGIAKSTAQAPAAAAPVAPESAMEEMGPAADLAPAEPEEGHGHDYAWKENRNSAMGTWRDDSVTVIAVGEDTFTLTGEESAAVTEILLNLPYDPERICRCMAEMTVDVDGLSGIQVSLEQGFARCERGQADLTHSQADTLRKILDKLP